MNKKESGWTNRLGRKAIARRLMLQYVASLLGFVVILALAVVVGISICLRFTWQADNIVYILLKFIEYNIAWVSGVLCIAGWTVITYRFIAKPLRYLNEVVDAAETLVHEREEPVRLSEAMGDVENELNLVREQALRNTMIAREAEQRKNDLVVYLAHDLKTPLTSVIGYLTLLRDEPQISPELRTRYTGIALDKAQRLEELINEFFDITRFNLTTLVLETERINLSRMLEQIIDEFRPVLAEKELSIRTSIVPDVEILCDPDKLERVFDNLIRNAASYSYERTEIYFSMVKQIEDRVEISIWNRGKTIPKEKLEHIFEQFFRLDSSRSSATGGAGLGLAIAREIVELHGGTIRAESAKESVVFTVVLPAGQLPRLPSDD